MTVRALLALAFVAAPLPAQWTVRGTGFVAAMRHRVDAGFGAEPSSGAVGGTELTIGVGNRFALALMGQAGSLGTQAPGAIARDVAEVGVRLDLVALPWLVFQAGAGHRTYSTVLARQSWTTISAGAETRLAFSEKGVRGIIRGALLPGAWVNGLETPDLAFTGAAGMEGRVGHAVFALLYSLERYRFPAGAMPERREQTTALRAEAGWSLR